MHGALFSIAISAYGKEYGGYYYAQTHSQYNSHRILGEEDTNMYQL